MSQTILEQISAAQAAPADDYMVWAEIGEGAAEQSIVLQTVRLPQALKGTAVEAQIKGHAAKILKDCGYSPDEIEGASFRMSLLPSAEEVIDELETSRAAGHELVLGDLTFWEACRLRLHLKPRAVDGGDDEMDYNGLKIRRSATG